MERVERHRNCRCGRVVYRVLVVAACRQQELVPTVTPAPASLPGHRLLQTHACTCAFLTHTHVPPQPPTIECVCQSVLVEAARQPHGAEGGDGGGQQRAGGGGRPQRGGGVEEHGAPAADEGAQQREPGRRMEEPEEQEGGRL